MYKTIECVQLFCDNCGEVYMNEHSGFSIFVDDGSIGEHAGEDGWHDTKDDKHYCADCHEFDDDDNLILKQLNQGESPRASVATEDDATTKAD